jgi:HJR/Mrr/RecB family endonuclease
VRPHRRGDAAAQQRQRIYRSRSASSILYNVLGKIPSGIRPRWFDFEKDVAAFMASKGLTVVHQAASRNGDGGVDIYAHDEANDQVWAIQCKCYALARKVGPNVVRELAGSLHRYPDGTRGMIVTSSSFTQTAIQEATALSIELLDGEQFAVLVKNIV